MQSTWARACGERQNRIVEPFNGATGIVLLMNQRTVGYSHWFVILAVAIGLTIAFWSPLWSGGGFVGGDIYSYFLPQKAFYSEHLKAGEFPLWNNRTGFGYPLVGESQTGAFYPINLILYPTLELNTAYNVSFLLHYVLAFVFTALYVRRLGVGLAATVLAATVYVYGWFPARCSLEWAIIGGTWLPLALWCAESFVQTRRRRFLAGLSLTLAVQLLAGHFCLAFVTQLTLVGYVGLRLTWFRRVFVDAGQGDSEKDKPQFQRRSAGLAIGIAIAVGFVLAAVQLLPTWELKQQSQRLSVTEEHDPGYGHIPPMYLSQVVASWWFWHSPEVDVDRALRDMKLLALNSRTNKTEAHLYFGLLPLLLVVVGLFASGKNPGLRRVFWIWAVLGMFAAIYATGLLLPVTKHLPGFSFFEGLGRYGIASTFAVAVMSAIVFDQWSRSKSRAKSSQFFAATIGLVLIGLTVWDLYVVGRQMAVSVMVPAPPIHRLEQSPLRKMLADYDQPQRLFAPGPNLPNLLGQSSSPVYLGLGPAEYFDVNHRFPDSANVSDSLMPTAFAETQREWLIENGVTHVVRFEADSSAGGAAGASSTAVVDPFLGQAWARREPVYVQHLADTKGRVGSDSASATVRIAKYLANRVEIEVTGDEEHTVVLRDLYFPGWNVAVDGIEVNAIRDERPFQSNAALFAGPFRSVKVAAGKHRVVWTYKPVSIYWGIVTSCVGVALLFGMTLVGRRRKA